MVRINSGSEPATLDLLTEDVISLSQAAKELPSRPNASTIWRFAKRGIRGEKLETIEIGARIFTSRQALTRFLQRTQRH